MSNLSINGDRLMGRLRTLGDIGRDTDGRLVRLAGSDADREARDQFATWATEAGLEMQVDRIGNQFAIWRDDGNRDAAPIMMGSHIDSVINAGIYDGCLGVLGGLEVLQTLKEAGIAPGRPIVVGAFTNEEGVRYAPDMLGSLAYVGGMPMAEALATAGTDGTVIGAELARIGYAGGDEPDFPTPHCFLELHIEQGPVLEREGVEIGAVENLQGISWQRVEIKGVANHAGTTPTSMRTDAGLAAARVVTFLRDQLAAKNDTTVATVGTIELKPNAINVIPSAATFTVDLRDPDEDRLKAAETALADYLAELGHSDGVTISTERLARFEPVTFDAALADRIERTAQARGHSVRRMTSGAGHDAQMLARVAPSAMIFVPSKDGISHNPREHTEPAELIAGANVLLDVVAELLNEG